jgi:hypothetical protein
MAGAISGTSFKEVVFSAAPQQTQSQPKRSEREATKRAPFRLNSGR